MYHIILEWLLIIVLMWSVDMHWHTLYNRIHCTIEYPAIAIECHSQLQCNNLLAIMCFYLFYESKSTALFVKKKNKSLASTIIMPAICYPLFLITPVSHGGYSTIFLPGLLIPHILYTQ